VKKSELRGRVDELASEPDRMRRRLVALGALTARLAPQGIEPILVGGCALEVYTDGGYNTGDVDLALPKTPEVDAAFADLGFAKRGRFWVRPELDLVFEAPAPAGLPGETAPRTELEIDGLRIVVLGVEDLLIDRLRAWVHWKSDEDGRWTARLAALYADDLDWEYLRSRVAGDAGESSALERLERETR
jgi:predicted nucleotidyltransferase